MTRQNARLPRGARRCGTAANTSARTSRWRASPVAASTGRTGSGMGRKDTLRGSDRGGFHFPGGERRAAPHPEADAAWLEILLQALRIPGRVSKEYVPVRARAVAVLAPVLGRERREVQHATREATEIGDGARGRAVVEILQH